MKDRIVFDIETKNTFADVGGKENLKNLDVSVVCAYSYNQNAYLTFWEKDLEALGKVLQDAGLLIGFSINRFDVPVLEKYFPFNINVLYRLDLLEEIELSCGHRISLDLLAKANLGGVGKTSRGLEAIHFYASGDLKSLEEYCRNDVKITKDLYDLAERQGYLLLPKRNSNEFEKVALDWKGRFDLPATLF